MTSSSINFKDFDYYSWLFVFLPIVVMIEGLFTPPLYSVDINVNETTLPIVFSFLFFINILNLKIGKTNQLSIFYLLVILISYLITFTISFERFGVILSLILSFLLFNHISNRKNYYDVLFYFVLCFSLFSLTIYFYRLNLYDFDFIRTRGGANIYGGNTLFIVQALFLAFTKRGSSVNTRRHNLILFLLAVNSLLFINRLSIALIPIILLSNYGFKKLFFSVTGILSIIYYYYLENLKNFELFNNIVFRFSVDNPMGTRIPIIIDAFSLIEQNPIIGIGIGMFKEYGTQTSAHNLFLNIITEMGLFLGLMIIIMIIYPLFNFLKYKKYQASVYYTCFLLVAIISGEKLLQFSGFASCFNSVMLFVIFRQLRK